MPSPSKPDAQPVPESEPGATSVEVAYENEPLPTDPSALLLIARNANGLGSPELKPWYLKAHYQAYDATGQPAGTGVFEMYRAARNRIRTSYTGDRFTASYYETPAGRFRAGSPARMPYVESLIEQQVLWPVHRGPMEALEIKKSHTQATEAVCLLGKIPQGPQQSYCFDTSRVILRVADAEGFERVYNKTRLFQHRFVAGSIEVFDSGHHVFTLEVDELRGLKQADLAALEPPADLLPLSKPSTLESSSLLRQTSEGSVHPGKVLTKVQPDYPLSVKRRGVQGVVRLRAVIGKDGSVQEAEVVFSPDPLLSAASLAAVLKWKYEPYTLNGQPVEVQTMLSVFFALGR